LAFEPHQPHRTAFFTSAPILIPWVDLERLAHLNIAARAIDTDAAQDLER
jgi:hypothetical protein